MNYRSVTVFGRGKKVTSNAMKIRALKAISDKYVPGRWGQVRFPSPQEMKSVAVVKISTAHMSGKTRTGPPKDFEKDLSVPVWAGEIPFKLIPDRARPDPLLSRAIALPRNIRRLIQSQTL